MNRLFGTGSKKPAPSLTDAIGNVDTRIDQTNVRIRKLDAELAAYKDKLKNVRSGPGRKTIEQKAIRVLQRKKMYESQVEQLERQRDNMEQTSMTTDNLRDTMASVQVLQHASKEMKKQHAKIDIDKIDSIRDEMEDLLEQSNEIQESLGQSYGTPDDIDEVDLQAELDALGDDLMEDETKVPWYLEGNKAEKSTDIPDFIDEAPQPQNEHDLPAQPAVERAT